MKNVIKRNGEEVLFNIDKIVNAITKANAEVKTHPSVKCGPNSGGS